MKNTLFTAGSILATSSLVSALGHAIVSNQCDYDVYLFAVPAANVNGQTASSPGALKKGGIWSQQWTGLTSASGTHDGWSIKLSKENNLASNSILQYEYTYQPTVDANLVWLDLSSVDGGSNPWLKDGWTLQSTQSCGLSLLQNVSYTTPDDNAAMQPGCPASADLEVILCQWPGGAASSTKSAAAISTSTSALVSSASLPNPVSAVSSLVQSVVAPLTSALAAPTTTSTTAAAPTTTSAAAASTTTSAAQQSNTHFKTFNFGDASYAVGQKDVAQEASTSTTAEPTTFATQVKDFFGHTVTEIETAIVTAYVTAYAERNAEPEPEPTPEVFRRHVHHGGYHHQA